MIVVLLRFDFAGKCSQRVGVRYVTVGFQLSTTAYSLLTEVFSDNVMVPNRTPAENSHACSVTNMNSSNILEFPMTPAKRCTTDSIARTVVELLG